MVNGRVRDEKQDEGERLEDNQRKMTGWEGQWCHLEKFCSVQRRREELEKVEWKTEGSLSKRNKGGGVWVGRVNNWNKGMEKICGLLRSWMETLKTCGVVQWWRGRALEWKRVASLEEGWNIGEGERNDQDESESEVATQRDLVSIQWLTHGRESVQHTWIMSGRDKGGWHHGWWWGGEKDMKEHQERWGTWKNGDCGG